MTAFVNAFGVFALLLDLAALGFLIYIWARLIRRRRETLARWGWMKRILVLAFLLWMTVVFVVASVWAVPSLFD